MHRIAPPELLGREHELTELAQFCTAAEAGPYRWWRAPAWAGKSALMSWFVLHPPAGVRVVSFFITARFAGQSDRIAFTDVVVEQLAELLDEPMPAMTDATRELCFLYLLARTAAARPPPRPICSPSPPEPWFRELVDTTSPAAIAARLAGDEDLRVLVRGEFAAHGLVAPDGFTG